MSRQVPVCAGVTRVRQMSTYTLGGAGGHTRSAPQRAGIRFLRAEESWPVSWIHLAGFVGNEGLPAFKNQKENSEGLPAIGAILRLSLVVASEYLAQVCGTLEIVQLTEISFTGCGPLAAGLGLAFCAFSVPLARGTFKASAPPRMASVVMDALLLFPS